MRYDTPEMNIIESELDVITTSEGLIGKQEGDGESGSLGELFPDGGF